MTTNSIRSASTSSGVGWLVYSTCSSRLYCVLLGLSQAAAAGAGYCSAGGGRGGSESGALHQHRVHHAPFYLSKKEPAYVL